MEPVQAELKIQKIISGGQTGVDRAALDIGLELRIPIGGFCPKGRRSEDGSIPAKYPMIETASADYRVRTEKNVIESDGTLILTIGQVSGGTAYTIKMAKKNQKPYFVVQLEQDELDSIQKTTEWITQHQIRILNVAGSRESKTEGIHRRSLDFLRKLFGQFD